MLLDVDHFETQLPYVLMCINFKWVKVLLVCLYVADYIIATIQMCDNPIQSYFKRVQHCNQWSQMNKKEAT